MHIALTCCTLPGFHINHDSPTILYDSCCTPIVRHAAVQIDGWAWELVNGLQLYRKWMVQKDDNVYIGSECQWQVCQSNLHRALLIR